MELGKAVKDRFLLFLAIFVASPVMLLAVIYIAIGYPVYYLASKVKASLRKARVMKNIITIITVLLIILNLASFAYCDGPAKKLYRGMANVLTCPLEVPNRMLGENARKGVNDVLWGLGEGASMMLIRAVVGAVEIVTFPFPVPDAKYGPILNDPEFLMAWPPKANDK